MTSEGYKRLKSRTDRRLLESRALLGRLRLCRGVKQIIRSQGRDGICSTPEADGHFVRSRFVVDRRLAVAEPEPDDGAGLAKELPYRSFWQGAGGVHG